MSYDKWKLSNPHDDGWTSDEVTSCCGVEQEPSGVSNCCGAKLYPESDICTKCKEHAEEYMICTECGEDEECYTLITLHEYQERRREDAQEYYRDED